MQRDIPDFLWVIRHRHKRFDPIAGVGFSPDRSAFAPPPTTTCNVSGSPSCSRSFAITSIRVSRLLPWRSLPMKSTPRSCPVFSWGETGKGFVQKYPPPPTWHWRTHCRGRSVAQSGHSKCSESPNRATPTSGQPHRRRRYVSCGKNHAVRVDRDTKQPRPEKYAPETKITGIGVDKDRVRPIAEQIFDYAPLDPAKTQPKRLKRRYCETAYPRTCRWKIAAEARAGGGGRYQQI